MMLFADASGAFNDESSCAAGQIHFFKKHAGSFDAPVFDVGAHHGSYALELRKFLKPEIPIFCFEPHPLTFKVLQANLASVANMHALNMAAGNVNGKSNLFDGSGFGRRGSPLASSYRGVIESLHNMEAETYEIDMLILDDFCSSKGISRISLLKIDVEGGELDVLKGFSEYVSAGKIDFINFEFHEMNVISRVFFRDFWEMLSPKYAIYRLIPGGMIELREYKAFYCEIFGYQNILAKLKK